MARNSQSLRYSYKCKDASSGNFQNKNFNKTESYNSKFTDSIFKNTSLVGAKFKFCNLNRVIFEDCLIQGTLFRKCPMESAKFKNCIIISADFDRTSLKDCVFESCIILDSPMGAGFKDFNLIGSEILDEYYAESEFSNELLRQVELLRKNQYINRSSVLHRKKGRLNTVSIKLLLKEFDEEALISALPIIGSEIKKGFYTISYLSHILHKLMVGGNVSQPGPLQHGKYLNEQAETSLRTDAG